MADKPLARTLMRVMPIGFLLGAAMEYFMITVRIGNETFYQTATRLEADRRAERIQRRKDLEQRVLERQTKQRTEE